MKKKKKVIFITLLSLFLLLLISSVTFADYGTAHVLTGKFKQAGTTLKYYKSDSVSQYGYTGAVDNAASKWDSASSKITLTSTTSSECKGCIPVYVGENVLDPGLYGVTEMFTSGLLGWSRIPDTDIAYSYKDFDLARIRLDHKHMTNENFNQNNRWKSTGHEFGHALSLFHFENSPAHSGNNWMTSGKIDLASPTTTDKDHLTNKWGY